MLDTSYHRSTKFAEYAVFPGTMLLAFVLVWIPLTRGISLPASIGISYFITWPIVALLELLMPIRREATFIKDINSLHDIGFVIMRRLTGRSVSGFIIGTALSAGFIKGLSVWPVSAPIIVQAMLYYLLYSFFQYWEHRAGHEYRVLWFFHAIHHSPPILNQCKKDRHHFFDSMIKGTVMVFLPLAIIGAPGSFLLWLTLYESTTSLLKHSNVRQRFFPWMHYIFPTSNLHHLHHSSNMAHGNSNYGNFPVWDLVFRTYTPAHHGIDTYGVPGGLIPQNVFRAHIYPFTAIWRDIQRRRANGGGLKARVARAEAETITRR